MAAPPPRDWAVVVNPSKFDDLTAVKELVARIARAHSWPEPRWYETTEQDPGTGQARQAVADGAGLVCPLGGDGTVRCVAAGLLDAGVPLGLLPGGTGNLLARNLGLPIDDLEAALAVAITGTDAPVDAGLVAFDGAAPEVFLVMAGMGLDAQTVGGATVELKRQLGWFAYAVSGIRSVLRAGFRVSVRAGDQRAFTQHAATVMIGNCGELTGGMKLMPAAKVDDGLLDAVVVSPRSLGAWLAVGVYILTRNRFGHSAIAHLVGPDITVTAAKPIAAQLDGDAVGTATRLVCSVRAGALRVRVPAASGL